MDCGIPYCHNGCPVNNQIPDWNDLVYRDQWKTAALNLHSTNNFPEVTGRVCPAPCEASCTLNIDDKPVTIKTIECAIADKAFAGGLDRARAAGAARPARRSPSSARGRPAWPPPSSWRAPATRCTSTRRAPSPAGCCVYGIPDFKMEKGIVERRVKQMEAEGVVFHCNVHVGKDVAAQELEAAHDARAAGRRLRAAVRLLRQVAGARPRRHPLRHDISCRSRTGASRASRQRNEQQITAKDKHVIVIGGGDTGSDCIGTSFRQGAKSVTQLEIMPMPPEKENKALSWPHWPLKLRVSSSQAEGAKVEYSISTTGFAGKNGKVEKLLYTRVDKSLKPMPGSEGELPADLVLFAMGFSGPIEGDVVKELEPAGRAARPLQGPRRQRARLSRQGRSQKVFAAGDIRRGQSLVVWAIREGRQAAHAIDRFLMGRSDLPR